RVSFVCFVRLRELLDLAFASNSSLVERRDLRNGQEVTTPDCSHQSAQRVALLTGNVRRGPHRGPHGTAIPAHIAEMTPASIQVPRGHLSRNGRTWDRTRDLSRVKRALSR